MNKPIICHVVAGYPSFDDCLQLMLGMQQIGVAAIEVQIPFSDPIADGETIMEANDVALNGGMTTASSLSLIEAARSQGVNTDIYIMSYLQKVGHFGFEYFCKMAADCKVQGLIIPDLPYDSPEADELQQLTADKGLQLIPVLSPGMAADRLQAILARKPQRLYITSSQGITGNEYAPADQLKQLVATIRQQTDATLMIGFGISTPQDVQDVLAIGDVAVVGSAVIKKIKAGGVAAALEHIRALAAGL